MADNHDAGQLLTTLQPNCFRRNVLLLSCAVCYIGVNFGAWDWPSIDGYPAVERFLDPTFLSTDFYTNTTEGYGVDTVLAYVCGTFQMLTGIDYESAVAVLNLIRCLLLPWLLFYLFNALSGRQDVALLAVILGTVSNFSLPKTPGWGWLWGDASTAMFATMAILAGWTLLINRKSWECCVLFALAALIHPLMTVYGAIFVLLTFASDYTSAERLKALRSPATLLSGCLFVAAMGFQYFMLSPDKESRLSTKEYLQILAYARHVGDFIPSKFSRDTWLAFGAAFASVILILGKLGGEFPRRRLVVAGVASYAVLCLLGFLFVELLPVRFFIQLIPFRYVIVGAPLLLLVLTVFAVIEVRQGHGLVFVVVASAFALASPFYQKFRPFDFGGYTPSALLITAVVTSRLLMNVGTCAPFDRWIAYILQPRPFTALTVAVLTAAGSVAGYARYTRFIVPTVNNQHPVYAWVHDNTDEDSVFLLDQHSRDGTFADAINPQKIRLIGRRAVVASMDFPFLDKDMPAWYDRWLVALQNGAYDCVEQADVETLLEIHRKYSYHYVIRRTPLPESSRIHEAARFDPWDGVAAVFLFHVKSRQQSSAETK